MAAETGTGIQAGGDGGSAGTVYGCVDTRKSQAQPAAPHTDQHATATQQGPPVVAAAEPSRPETGTAGAPDGVTSRL
jgi:hypothetical protein